MKPFPRHLSTGLMVAFVLACAYGLRHDIALISFTSIARSWDLVLLAALCSLLNYALRIVRWQRYMARLGSPLPLVFTSLTYIAGFAFTVSPGKVGEMARARYYSRLGIPVSDVAGAFCVERLMDLVAILALATLILTAAPRYHAALWCTAAVIAVVLVLLAALPWAAIANRFANSSDFSPRPPRRLIQLGAGIAKALNSARSLLQPSPLLLGFLLGLAAWGLEGLGLYVLGSMFPAAHHVTPEVSVGIYAVAVLVGAISFLPGGLGSTEAVMTALLAAQGFPVGDALAVTIVCRVVTLWFAVCIGWVAVFALRHRLTPAVAPWR
jgi:uncharacterized protein (TIRG00374 family)